MRRKKTYQVTLNIDSTEKVIQVLKLQRLTLSAYLTVLVDEFAKVIDETGFSDKLEKLTVSDSFHLVGDILKGLEIEKKTHEKK